MSQNKRSGRDMLCTKIPR